MWISNNDRSRTAERTDLFPRSPEGGAEQHGAGDAENTAPCAGYRAWSTAIIDVEESFRVCWTE
jgi:hypothetical protein